MKQLTFQTAIINRSQLKTITGGGNQVRRATCDGEPCSRIKACYDPWPAPACVCSAGSGPGLGICYHP
ncbi:hypothetical protein KTO58_07245 [Chitinophaga pendula]|uniref:hypothetical protein n=1 Tax=Chitinophaga TaxID=79328 RepID=UPI000BAFF397|nr:MULTISPECIES: hypothetical protein [Chitinophaga]ASZ13407.1 hypothetical protein CK934_21800 [Chitinophaga sp. MD30]UCJ08971.1 hypothetical protein KTO58_07245 [Chitinophaga pendula]